MSKGMIHNLWESRVTESIGKTTLKPTSGEHDSFIISVE